jgi:hypothetical protein
MGGFDFTGGKIMAERRMFAKTIIDSDAFIDMPMSARLLYYDLGMRADDDGFVNSPKKIMKFSGASDDDLRILSAKKFIIPFESGVVVIKHWKIHNYIRKDTYTETKYKGEKALLYTDENNAYSTTNPLLNSGDETPSTIRGRDVDEPSTQVRLGKVSVVKDSIDSADKPLSDFDIAINNFKDHRKKIKKPMTDHAVDLLKKELQKYAPDDMQKQIELIDRAIMKGWQGVYPIDNFKKGDRVEPTEKDYTTSTSAYEIL